MAGSGKSSDDDRQTSSKRSDHAPKLRSTCDRCTMLKVRCDKQKPRCERCEAANAQCTYGPYRWKSRAAASASRGSVSSSVSRASPEATSSTTATNQPSASISPNMWDIPIPTGQAAPQGPFDPKADVFPGSLEFRDTSMIPAWDEMIPSTDWYGRLMDVDQDVKDDITKEESFALMLEGASSDSGVLHQPHHESYEASSASSFINSLSRMGSTTDFGTLGGCAAAFSNSSNSSNSPHSSRDGTTSDCRCASLVFNVLQDMYNAESRCQLTNTASENSSNSSRSSSGGGAISNNSNNLPQCDEIVKINRAAVQHMEQLISCDCQAYLGDPTLLFLVTALSSKLLASYRTVFAAIKRPLPQSSSSSLLDPGLGVLHDGDLFDLAGFGTPVQVGDFHLDFSSEQRMKAQFLLCEVRRLGQTLDALGARTSRSQQEELAKARGLPIPDTHLYLTASLNQLTTALKEYCVS